MKLSAAKSLHTGSLTTRPGYFVHPRRMAACLRRPSVVVVEPAQHREGHDAPAGLYAARPLPLVRDPLPDPLVRSPPV